jgi:hypothetical protein
MSLTLFSFSDVAAVLAADFQERLGNLLKAAHPGSVHQDGEHVVARAGRILQRGERLVRLVPMPLGEIADPLELGFLFVLGAPGKLSGRGLVAGGVAEGVDADDRQGCS